MCIGSGPSAPTIEYVGPSESDIRRQEKALEQYRTDMQLQQETFQTQLQSQIDSANDETAALSAQYQDQFRDMEEANAAKNKSTMAGYDATNADTAAGYASDSSSAAALAAAEMASYTTSATQTEVPEGAQTTAAVTEKKKPKKNLKISTAGTANQAGSGLNIGV